MPGRPPREKCIVNWASDPSKAQRLLDWLDTHDAEREILFAIGVRGEAKRCLDPRLSKVACGTRAATTIFANDSNIILREHVIEDPLHYGKIVCDHIRNGLKKKYQKFNKEIGPHAANLRYQDVRIGGKLHKKIDQLMSVGFPEWARLHVYWRTNSYFNQYYQYHTPTYTPIDTPTSSRHSTRIKGKKAQKNPTSEVIVIDDDSEDAIDMHSDDIENTNCCTKQSFAKSSSSEIKIEPEDSSEDEALKFSQSHELRMEELRIERRRLDIQKAQLEAEALKRREKHEIMLQLMAFVNGEAPDMSRTMMEKAHSI